MERELREELGFDMLDLEPNELKRAPKGAAVGAGAGGGGAHKKKSKAKATTKKRGTGAGGAVDHFGTDPNEDSGVDLEDFVNQHSFEKVSAVRNKAVRISPSKTDPSYAKALGHQKQTSKEVTVGSKEHISSLLSQVGNIQAQLQHLTSEDRADDGHDDDSYGEESGGSEDPESARMARINSVINQVRRIPH
jgi:hypothetical protein